MNHLATQLIFFDGEMLVLFPIFHSQNYIHSQKINFKINISILSFRLPDFSMKHEYCCFKLMSHRENLYSP